MVLAAKGSSASYSCQDRPFADLNKRLFKSNSSSRETCCCYTWFMCLDLPIGQNLNFLSVCVQRAKRPPKLMDLILKESSRKKKARPKVCRIVCSELLTVHCIENALN